MYTPWGESDFVEDIAEGIQNVSTPSHDGILLSMKRQNQLPEIAFKKNCLNSARWWEEDCDWVVPYLFFWEDFKRHNEETGWPEGNGNYDVAVMIAEQHHPEFYQWLKENRNA